MSLAVEWWLCLRRGIVSNVMLSCKAKREVVFGEYEKQIRISFPSTLLRVNSRLRTSSFDNSGQDSAGGVLSFVMVFSFLRLM